MRKTFLNRKTMWTVGLIFAVLFLMRGLMVKVYAYEDVETYEAATGSDDSAGNEATDDVHRVEIRLSRPDEAASRIADQGYEMVPGADRLNAAQHESIIVPRKTGRVIAATDDSVANYPESPVPVREEMQGRRPASLKLEGKLESKAGTSKKISTRDIDVPDVAPAVMQSRVDAKVMEPKPFTVSDAKTRSESTSGESVTVGESQRFGLKAEPRFQSAVEEPMPSSPVRTGVQEVSIIVSDYGYFPAKVFVTQNIPVKLYLTATSKSTLCFINDNWGLRKGVTPGKVEEVTFVPDEPGDYRFYCPVKSIEGKITVRESQVAGQSLRGLASQALAAEKKEVKKTDRNEPREAAKLRALADE